MTTSKKPDGVVCPFCGDDGFDLIGLKLHFIGSYVCEVFEATPTSDPPKHVEAST